MTLLSVRQLSKQYGEYTAVDGLSFSVEKGDIYGFLGPNGAGK
ncbi:MAG: export ABC transporter ATP-binding protein, partial [Bacteroidota bacterium]